MPQTNLTILGGLPVTVEYSIGRPEPDVGLTERYVEEYYFTHINGRRIKSDNWIQKRILQTGEYMYIEEKLLDY